MIRSVKTKLRRGKHRTEMAEPGGGGGGGGPHRNCLDNPSLESTQLLGAAAPSSPPPSYETAIAESRLEEARGQEAGEEGGAGEKTKPEELLIVHKSSKELYKALAAQWGITCKMSDHCRCYDCQSHYFDCEYDRDNDQEKTDGGLGAGTPMFISEVMHGTACVIL